MKKPRRIQTGILRPLVSCSFCFTSATSAFFLSGLFLPKAKAASQRQITISDAFISPFQVVLRDLKSRHNRL